VHHGWEHDLGAYRTRFQAFDIGVAPVKPTPHSLGRSDLKALEMAMGLCAPILSDVACYEEWTDGENCLKAKDAKGFRKALQHLIQNPDEAKQLAAAAREYVLRERKIEDEIHAWEEAIA
jgi:glycosyltransferase involved in cell wall biosynthesis